MIARIMFVLILVPVQVVCGWLFEPQLTYFLPSTLNETALLFSRGVVYALVVTTCGLLLSLLFHPGELPGWPRLVGSVVMAWLGVVAILILAINAIPLPRGVNPDFLILGGAILGYYLRR